VGVFLWNTSEWQNGGFLHGNRHFSKTEEKEYFLRKIFRFFVVYNFVKEIEIKHN